MPGIVALVAALSADVVTGLAAVGITLCPNQDGTAAGILLGKQHQFEHHAPPRIIFTPTKSAFAPRDTARGVATKAANQPYDAESRVAIARRSVMSESITFEVRCWGIAPTTAPDADYDYTQVLYQQVLISTHLLTAGNYKVEGGAWTDDTLVVRAGREFVFGITFGTPVLDKLLPFAPSNVAPNATDTLVMPDGTSGAGCT